MSNSVNNTNGKFIDVDAQQGHIKILSSGTHVIGNQTPIEVAKKYFIYPDNYDVDSKQFIRYKFLKRPEKGMPLIEIPSVHISVDDIVIKGPFVPYKDEISGKGTKFDSGPTRPGISIAVTKDQYPNLFEIINYFDLCAKCAYIFNESKCSKIIPASREEPLIRTFFPKFYSGKMRNLEDENSHDFEGFYICSLFQNGETSDFFNITGAVNFSDRNIDFANVKANLAIFSKVAEIHTGEKPQLVRFLSEGMHVKSSRAKSAAFYLKCDFILRKGDKTRKTGENPTSAEDQTKMLSYDHWKFCINVALREPKQNKICTITGPGGAGFNWYDIATEEKRKTPFWTSFIKAYPVMENLPLPTVNASKADAFAYKGGVSFSISSVGYGMNVAKTHFQIEQTYILPEPVANGRKIEGDTVMFSMEPQFGHSEPNGAENTHDNVLNNFQDEDE